jgi:hypothetical protein
MRIDLPRNREQRSRSQLERDRVVHTGRRRIGTTPGLRSRTTRILAVACVVVVHSQQPADSLVISQDQFDDVERCARYPCERDWLAPAGSRSPTWDRWDGERPAG